MSRQFWTGLDQSGNPISKSFNDKEWYDDILPIYTVKPENPRQRDSKMIREVTSIEHRRKYTVPFKAETVQKLYDMKNGSYSLAIKDESVDTSLLGGVIESLHDQGVLRVVELGEYSKL
jgi:hypothetical protein